MRSNLASNLLAISLYSTPEAGRAARDLLEGTLSELLCSAQHPADPGKVVNDNRAMQKRTNALTQEGIWNLFTFRSMDSSWQTRAYSSTDILPTKGTPMPQKWNACADPASSSSP